MDEKIDELIENKFRDIKLEIKILAYLLRRNPYLKVDLQKSFFTIEPYKKIFDLIQKKKSILPKGILYKHIKKEIEEDDCDVYKTYIKKIYNESLLHVNKDSINEIIADLKDLNELRNIFQKMREVLEIDMNKLNINIVKKKLKEGLYNTSTSKRDQGSYLEGAEKRIEFTKYRKENPKKYAGIPTGIKEFDIIAQGGLMKGEFGIIIAETGKGKSIALINFAANAWKIGKNVLFVSLEMPKLQIEYRLDSRITRIDHGKFRSANLEDNEFKLWKNKLQKLKDKKQNFLEILCLSKGCCMQDVEEEAMKTQETRKQKIDLIVVDYINLMSANQERGSKRGWESQAEVGWNFKELSLGFNDGEGIPLWTANQITDEGAKAKKIGTRHLKYARAISEVAPIIVALTQSVDDQLQDIMKMWIVKARDFEDVKKPIVLHPRFDVMLLNQQQITKTNPYKNV